MADDTSSNALASAPKGQPRKPLDEGGDRGRNALHGGAPVSQQAQHHQDVNAHMQSGQHAKPTRAFAGRQGAPAKHNTSGVEKAMGALADRLHKPGRR